MKDIVTEVNELIINARQSYYNYLKEQEMAATEREKSITQIKALSTALRAKREVMQVFTKNFFDERKMLRDMADNALNKAIETGDVELAQITMELIEFEYSKNLFEKLNHII
ncbi:MAG: hypothetical protein K0R80_2412 [Clostridia bacterium]|nr:hypothetical protein [Clostridia bacterium]